MNKAQAKRQIIAEGYTVHFATGESGDYGLGSREYYHKPNAKLNPYNQPLGDHATISRVGREWLISRF